MTINQLKLIIACIVSIIVIIFCLRVFSCNDQNTGKKVVDNTAELRKSLDKQIANYNFKIDSINKVNQQLRSQTVSTQSAILKVKQENRSLKRTINDLLTIHYMTTDTTVKLQNCDSLAIAVQEMEVLNNKKDSMYDSLTATLQHRLEIQDSVIDLQHFENDSLQTNYRQLLDKHTDLIAENAEQRKTIKKQKRGKGFISVVAAIAAGLFTWQSLK